MSATWLSYPKFWYVYSWLYTYTYIYIYIVFKYIDIQWCLVWTRQQQYTCEDYIYIYILIIIIMPFLFSIIYLYKAYIYIYMYICLYDFVFLNQNLYHPFQALRGSNGWAWQFHRSLGPRGPNEIGKSGRTKVGKIGKGWENYQKNGKTNDSKWENDEFLKI